MGRRPKLDYFIDAFLRGEEFAITRNDYVRITGIDIPQDTYYTKNRSAIAKKAHEYGYEIQIIPEQLKFVKTM